jgi:hypothetical protein
MPDFDTNEDRLRPGASGREEPFELPKLRPRFTPRARGRARERCFGARGESAARLQHRLGTRRWRAVRRSCPTARVVGLLTAMPSRRRRLWTTCHGRASGSSS